MVPCQMLKLNRSAITLGELHRCIILYYWVHFAEKQRDHVTLSLYKHGPGKAVSEHTSADVRELKGKGADKAGNRNLPS